MNIRKTIWGLGSSVECSRTKISEPTSAFTLAEVLITLVIIGVIAAITVPTLMAQYQKTQLISQFKKSFATIQNGFKSYLAKEGVTDLRDTTLWSKMPDNATVFGETEEFHKELSNIFVVTKQFKHYDYPNGYLINYKFLNADGNNNFDVCDAVILNDGSLFYYLLNKTAKPTSRKREEVKALGAKYTQYFGDLIIDVNGLKGPNKFGRDLFYFLLTPSGSLVPYGSLNASILMYQTLTDVWDSDSDDSCMTTTESYGIGCGARIIDEGWEMKY